jgi:hypothetical protein
MSWVVWIWRRSWALMGGAMCEIRVVKVGRAREVRSVPVHTVRTIIILVWWMWSVV